MLRWHHQFLGRTELPTHLTDLEIETFFTFTPHERERIASRYKPNPRIAAAIQLAFLKMAGRPLSAFKLLPNKLLRYVGEQRAGALRAHQHARGVFVPGRRYRESLFGNYAQILVGKKS